MPRASKSTTPTDSDPTEPQGWFRRRWDRLGEPVNRANIEIFRILFGAIMVWEVWRYISYGWVDIYNEQTHHLHYPGFEWVEPLPHDQLMLFFYGMSLLGLFICIGFLTRYAAIAFSVGFIYWFNLEATDYLNHLYLVALLSILVVVLPLGRSLSVDAWLFPKQASSDAPRWTLEILRWQVGLVYFFGGVAKMNPDWLQAQPMMMWLEDYCERPWPGEIIAQPEAAWVISYAGLALDLLAFPLLCWKRTRGAIMIVLVGFHLSNAWLFTIGIFPWFMIGALLLYCEPDWPQRFIQRLSGETVSRPTARKPTESSGFVGPSAVFFSTWLIIQMALPFRHLLYPGSPSWSEEGHWFAWHMKLRSKDTDIDFYIEDLDSGEIWRADLRDYFDGRQRRKLASHPELIRQTAWILSEEAAEDGHPNTRVTVDSWAGLNGRDVQRFIDPDVDLSKVGFEWGAADWILPQDPKLKLNPPTASARQCP